MNRTNQIRRIFWELVSDIVVYGEDSPRLWFHYHGILQGLVYGLAYNDAISYRVYNELQSIVNAIPDHLEEV